MIAARPGRTAALRGPLARLVLLAVVIFAAMAWAEPRHFLRPYNFISMTFEAPEIGLLSIAMMLAMLTGGIDLSVIGIADLSGILAGLFFHAIVADPHETATLGAGTVAIGVALALLTGIVAGVVNGALIVGLRITPILATIGTGQIFTGLALVLTGGPAIVGFPPGWAAIGNDTVAGIAIPLILLLVVAGIVSLTLALTQGGIALTLIGASARVARFAGLRTGRTVFLSYVATGFLASLAGVILSGRVNAAKSDYGVSYLLQSVLIAVLGGTNPAGGRGSVAGILVGLFALMMLSSGLEMMRFSNFLVDFVWGAFLLLAIALNALDRFRMRRS